jgi:hypothetical protein
MSTQSNWAPAITVELKVSAPAVKEFHIVAPLPPSTTSPFPRVPFIVENLGPHGVTVQMGSVSTTLADVGAAGYFVSVGDAIVFLVAGATDAKLRITLGSPWST